MSRDDDQTEQSPPATENKTKEVRIKSAKKQASKVTFINRFFWCRRDMIIIIDISIYEE